MESIIVEAKWRPRFLKLNVFCIGFAVISFNWIDPMDFCNTEISLHPQFPEETYGNIEKNKMINFKGAQLVWNFENFDFFFSFFNRPVGAFQRKGR